MKRHAGGTAPGGDPADATDVTGGVPSGAGPAGYPSSDHQDTGGAELLEDRTLRITGGGHGRRFGLSVPGAIAGSFLIAALAFGAALGPLTTEPGGETGHDTDVVVTEPTDAVDAGAEQPDAAGDVDQPAETDDAVAPDDLGGADATDAPKPTAVPAPDSKVIEIGVGLDGRKIVVEWSACHVDGFVAYKVIRSLNEAATWPLGAGDSLAAAIGESSTTRFVDGDVDAGRTYTYRIIALREWNGEKVVACSSVNKSIATPAATPKPVDDAVMSITVTLKEGHPFIDWSACGVDFSFYKVVRSTDSTVTWPVGDNDAKVAAVGVDGETKFWDANAPSGKTLYYRVFCIRETEAGHVAVASSAVKGIETPVGEPAPAPVALGFETNVSGEGVVLSWQTCGVDNFVYYKVVRSTTTQNPSYFPWTDGTELIGVIENQATAQFVDSNVASGQTIYYRVQCLGYWNGEKVLRGQTAVIAVTIP